MQNRQTSLAPLVPNLHRRFIGRSREDAALPEHSHFTTLISSHNSHKGFFARRCQLRGRFRCFPFWVSRFSRVFRGTALPRLLLEIAPLRRQILSGTRPAGHPTLRRLKIDTPPAIDRLVRRGSEGVPGHLRSPFRQIFPADHPRPGTTRIPRRALPDRPGIFPLCDDLKIYPLLYQ